MATGGSSLLAMEVFALVMIRTLLACSLIVFVYVAFRNEVQLPATTAEIKSQIIIEKKLTKSVTADAHKKSAYVTTLNKALVNLNDDIDQVEQLIFKNPDHLGLESRQKELWRKKKLYQDHLKYYTQ